MARIDVISTRCRFLQFCAIVDRYGSSEGRSFHELNLLFTKRRSRMCKGVAEIFQIILEHAEASRGGRDRSRHGSCEEQLYQVYGMQMLSQIENEPTIHRTTCNSI